ncbi:MAG: hypothetical protein KatS3mg115_0463 [Candidatus Poribacteria bacterium]|nr:MAG: hypothetical protein KatS3mg115_0463 [Candidatus Poribacteria bacterium]
MAVLVDARPSGILEGGGPWPISNSSSSGSLSFYEVQFFRQLWWFMPLLLLLTAWPLVKWFQQGGPIAPDNPLWKAMLPFLISGTTLIFLMTLRLETEVRTDGVYFRLFPLHLRYRRIGLEEIASLEARRYRPIRNFGGWGIRWGRLDGHPARAYNATGNRGVLFCLRDGRWILLGSQRPDELVAAVRALSG